MKQPAQRAEIDTLTAQTPTWRRLSALLVRTLAPFGDAARATAKALRADKAAPFVALAKAIETAIPPVPAQSTARDIATAQTFEERSLVCAELLMTGQWKTTTAAELAAVWGGGIAAISNYRRAGQVARAAMSLDFEEKLDDTLAHFLRMQETNERLADEREAAGDHAEAVRYRAIARAARRDYAEVGGLIQHRMSVSLEGDPRIAGMYQAILAALEDFDRLRGAFLAEVEKLTGGALPTAPLPSAREHVRNAVKRYEGEIGARAEARGRLAA